MFKKVFMLTMIIAVMVFLSAGITAQATASDVMSISGAGATFPYPVYAKWADAYNKVTGIKLNYQSIGSGGGIKQIKAKTVDFGASDAPLKPEDLDKSGLLQFPMIMGGVVPVVNIPGISSGSLKMSNELLADIYLGKVKKWNDEKIKTENPGLKLPDRAITVVHRSDGSGTTWIFTNYLSKVSPEWKSKVGNDKAVAWPAGVGGKGNEGVASYVQRIKGSIGYVEYAYALQNKLTYIKLHNRSGGFVVPSSKTFQAAAANADWTHAKGFYMVLTDQPGKDSWPITGASFILVYNNQHKPDVGKAALKFFDWCYSNGAKMAEKLDYVPMPDNVANLVRATWHEKIKNPQGMPIW
ncbi:MAG: phosphate ABC transporter substrate-binding protein PstS [Desulfobacterales bacterium]